jgi:hypothetical protein
MTTPRRREPPVDPYLHIIDKYRKRGWTLPCDCCCHFWPAIREAVPCCRSRGMRYIPSENCYTPWPEDTS